MRPTILRDAVRTLSLKALYLPDQKRILLDQGSAVAQTSLERSARDRPRHHPVACRDDARRHRADPDSRLPRDHGGRGELRGWSAPVSWPIASPRKLPTQLRASPACSSLSKRFRQHHDVHALAVCRAGRMAAGRSSHCHRASTSDTAQSRFRRRSHVATAWNRRRSASVLAPLRKRICLQRSLPTAAHRVAEAWARARWFYTIGMANRTCLGSRHSSTATRHSRSGIG